MLIIDSGEEIKRTMMMMRVFTM